MMPRMRSDDARGPPGARAGEGFAIVPLESSDEAECAALLVQAHGADAKTWRDRFDHWRRNPALGPGMPAGWVARDSDGGLAGLVANAPSRYVGESGETLVAYVFHTLAVSAAARGRGLGSRLIYESYRQPYDLALGSQTNAGGGKATVAGGGLVLDRPWTRRALLVVADPGALVLRALPGPLWLRRAAAAAARLAGSAAGLLERPARGIEVERIERFDPADDENLALLVASPARVRPLRDSGTLDWMYFGTPALRRSRLVLGARRDGRLAGYIAFRRLPDSLILLESRALPDEPDVLPVLIRAAIAWGRDHRIGHLLVWPHSGAIDEALPWARTFRAPARISFPFFIFIRRPGLAVDDLELGPWDGDAVIADDALALESPALE